MLREALTGTRIREKREIAGIKQADLARKVGISASYLNLIEHNRRRIGGKLLINIAATLDVEPQLLTEGAEVAQIAVLREAALAANLPEAEANRAEELVGRFPGWSRVLADAHQRIIELERTVESLSDRMAHDPYLASTLHEVLTTTAAIRSTAGILADTTDLEGPIRHRFHENIRQDSQRLSDSARTLVRFLDADPAETGATGTAEEDVSAWLERHDYAFPAIEAGTHSLDAILEATEFSSKSARRRAKSILERMQKDAAALPLSDLSAALKGQELDPADLASQLGLPVPLILRRLASLPELGCGLVVADRAGSLVYRKPVAGFAIPRLGAACPHWPIFDTLHQPGSLSRTLVRQGDKVFRTFAISEPGAWQGYNRPRLSLAYMLIEAAPKAVGQSVAEVGSTCRICPKRSCAGRREESILSEGP